MPPREAVRWAWVAHPYHPYPQPGPASPQTMPTAPDVDTMPADSREQDISDLLEDEH